MCAWLTAELVRDKDVHIYLTLVWTEESVFCLFLPSDTSHKWDEDRGRERQSCVLLALSGRQTVEDVWWRGETHREEGVDDVGFYGAERFVSDHDEDLLLFLQVDEVTEPRLLSQSVKRKEWWHHQHGTVMIKCSHATMWTEKKLIVIEKLH